jgi:hypothetical protein
MRQVLLFSVLSIGLLSSCSTAFKNGQTPDDVYYSPGRELGATREDETKQQKANVQYEEYISSLDDRYLRMKVANHSRWSSIDNFDYWNDSRYDFNSYNYYNNHNPYTTWNPYWNTSSYYCGNYYPGSGNWGWHSPVYTVVGYTTPKYGGSTSASNIYAYRNKSYNNTNTNNYGYNPKSGNYAPATSNSSFGNLLKKVFTSSENTSSSYDRPARTFNSSTNSNSPNTSPNTSSTPPATSSNAGGNSGGVKSTGSSTSTGRGGRG